MDEYRNLLEDFYEAFSSKDYKALKHYIHQDFHFQSPLFYSKNKTNYLAMIKSFDDIEIHCEIHNSIEMKEEIVLINEWYLKDFTPSHIRMVEWITIDKKN